MLVSEAVLLSEEGVSVGDGVEVGCVVGSTVGATEDWDSDTEESSEDSVSEGAWQAESKRQERITAAKIPGLYGRIKSTAFRLEK